MADRTIHVSKQNSPVVTESPSDNAPTVIQSPSELAVAIVAGINNPAALKSLQIEAERIAAATDAELAALGIPTGHETQARDWAEAQIVKIERQVQSIIAAAAKRSHFLAGQLAAAQAGVNVSDDAIVSAAREVKRAINRAGTQQETATQSSGIFKTGWYYGDRASTASHSSKHDTLEAATAAAQIHSQNNPKRVVVVYTGTLRHDNVETLRTFRNGNPA